MPLRVLDVADPAQGVASFAYQRLAAAWCAGASVDWAAFHAAERRQRVRLPAYVFDRHRYWIDRAVPNHAPQSDACAGWIYQPLWQPCEVASERPAGPSLWLVFDDGSNEGLCSLCDALRSQGDEVIRVLRDDGFAVTAPDVRMRATAHDVIRLATQLAAQNVAPHRILYGWQLRADAGRADDLEFLLVLTRYLVRGASDALAVLAPSIGADGAVSVARAALSGALRVIAQEASGVKARFVIVDQDADLQRVPAALDGAEAFRELWLSTQWMQRDYVRTYAPESVVAPDFRPDGCYLVIGGLGKVGQIVTSALSAQMPMQLALLGRYPVAADCGAERIDLRRPRVAASAWLAAIGEQAAAPSPHHAGIIAAQSLLSRLSVALVQAYAMQRLENFEPGCRYPLADFLAALCEAPALRRIAGTMLRVLDEGGVVVREAETVVVAALSTGVPAQIEMELVSSHADFAGAAARLVHCAAHFDDVLAGRRNGVSVLYPEGSAQFLRETAPGPSAHGDFRDAVERLRDGLSTLAAATGGRTLRILEIGGGNGSLTRQLAPTLQTLDVSYCFTDIGPSFVQGARRLAAENGYDWICARVLDIESDLGAQGFAVGEFDVILGFNVLHIAARLDRTIASLSTLLSPGGVFALVETLQWTPWTELVWGLTNDWWRYEDVDVRGDGPLLGAQQWLRVFQDAGFALSRVVAREGAMDGLVLAAAPDLARCEGTLLAKEAAVHRDAQVRRLVEAGCSVVCYRGDAGEPGDMQRLQESLISRFGALDGVVYAATTGMRAMGLIDEIDQRHIRSELATKVDGLANLDPLCARLTPSFVAVMSSMSSVLGGIGHYGYAAANAVQDAWCRNRPLQGRTRWLALNWDAWGDSEKSFGASVARHGLSGDEAVRALRAALRRGAGQWLISRHSLGERLGQWLRGADAPDPQGAAGARIEAASNDASTLQRVIALWKELLGRNVPVEPDSDFRVLGGDSLQAVQLVSLVRARFGRHVSLAEFVRAPTVANLVELVDARTAAWSPLVTLARGGDQSTLVCVHPGGGGIQCYRMLADALGGGGTIHALQSRRFGPDDLPPHRSVEAMAAEYRAAIESVDDGTPLILLGYCFGGMIAFEVAAQLEAAGRCVARLIIVDGHPPGVDDGFLDQRHFIETQAAMVTMQSVGEDWARNIALLSPEEQAVAVGERIDWSRAAPGAEAMIRRAVLEVILTNVAKNAYRPQATLHCDIDLLRIDDAGFHRDSNAVPHLGWQAFFTRTVDVRWITGEHHQLFDMDHIAPIAAHVRSRLPERGDMPSAVFVAGQTA
ncbi:thioesterase domain-containing protein [Tahibacter sp.]|uniref:KR domain-containing protein n=1 Tax=Tahibacter sp. TaxID=2056211 RepID=UPI0028C3F1B1|nr:thioesterase domain-containing protein [Tahibacter sp.]